MELMKLDESCRGKKLVFRYQTEYYYDVEFREREDTFTVALTRRAFPAPVEKSFTDTLLEPWLEEPQVFAAVEAGQELGYLERYWVSTENGLLIAAETSKDGVVVLRMSSTEAEVLQTADEERFTLPDGTVLHRQGE